eukprot:scaffold13.g277.t1
MARAASLALVLALCASLAAARKPPVWPDEYQISWNFTVPYVDEYQKEGLTYVYQVWQDTAVGRQKMVRNGVETTLTLIPENHMYQVFPAGDELRCWVEEIHSGTGPTLASAAATAPAAPSLAAGGLGAEAEQADEAGEQAAAVATARRLQGHGGARRGVKCMGLRHARDDAAEGAAPKSLAAWQIARLPFVLPNLAEDRWVYKGLSRIENKDQKGHLYEWDITRGEGMEMKYKFYVSSDDTPLELWQLGTNLYSGGHRDIYVSTFYDYKASTLSLFCTLAPLSADALSPLSALTRRRLFTPCAPGALPPGTFDPPSDIACKDSVAAYPGAPATHAAPPAMAHGTLAHAFALHAPAVHYGDEKYDVFCHRHGRRHRHVAHYAARAAAFHESRRFVEGWNSEQGKHRVGLNHFADWTREEYLALVRPSGPGGRRATLADRPGIKMHKASTPSHLLPAAVIWKGTPADSPVKDQGACGSCWAFSTAGAIEAAYYRETGMQKLFSEQSLVDCGWDANNSMKGCFGGEQSDAFDYIFAKGGMPSQDDYPYTGINGFCRRDAKKIGFKGELVWVTPGEADLKEALYTKGPLTVSIDASQDSFRFYTAGIYTTPDCKTKPRELDHAVIASGYGTTEDGQDFWLVKNTWSPYWGEEGYMRVARSPNDCGVSQEALYIDLNEIDG